MAGDAVSIAPHVSKVISENDKVRILDSTKDPGEKTEMHSHPAVVAIALTSAKVKFTLPGGQTMEAELEPGHAMYMDAADHATENVGSNAIRVILVEIK